MAKQLNVSLNFQANTSQAQAEIARLSNSLTKLAYGTIKIDDASIKKASEAAKELFMHLNKAYNAETGKIDLSKLDASLKSTKSNLSDLTSSIAAGGQLGQEAFSNVARAIADAEQPTIKLNRQLSETWTTLKNTLRWQISSSVIHSLQSTLASAYSYAKGLDKSLNDIRIVSGLSADEMDRFAEKANKSAQALSTTTKKYADAALIFYQQGLSDSEVEERTNATIKMANVTGEAVNDVSSYMTAVWNNFNKDGTKSVEHFGDVMTKLGADTAASTEEIAGGLEKFASVADTIGLSFEYATAAVTTIVDRTRQSEEVVGTALKTIFSRIQGLKQGETLDDGTDLNKYSQGLAKVGISIKDADGNLKDIDETINDIGKSWNNLSRDQKVALAQTVAGVRQYSQFMALFDNWDFMQQNLQTAYNADGTLNEQAEIYAESWEAARNRVRSAAEEIYSALLNKDFFIEFDNGLAEVLNGVADFIDQIGGIKTIFIGLGTIFMTVIKDKITPGLNQLKTNISILTGGINKEYAKIQQNNVIATQEKINSGNYSPAEKIQLENTNRLSTAKQKLALVARSLSIEEEAAANTAIEGLKYQQGELDKTAEKMNNLKSAVASMLNEISDIPEGASTPALRILTGLQRNFQRNSEQRNIITEGIGEIQQGSGEDYSIQYNYFQEYVKAVQSGQEDIINKQYKVSEVFAQTNQQIDNFSQEIISHAANFTPDQLQSSFEGIMEVYPRFIQNNETVRQSYQSLIELFNNGSFDMSEQNINELTARFNQLLTTIGEVEINGEQLGRVLQFTGGTENQEPIRRLNTTLRELSATQEEAIETSRRLNEQVNDFNPQHTVNGTEAFVSLFSAIGSASIALSGFQSLVDTLNNSDMSFLEKLTSSLMSVSMIAPGVMSTLGGLKDMGTWFSSTNIAKQLSILSTTQSVVQGTAGYGNAVKKRALELKLLAQGYSEAEASTLAATVAANGFKASILSIIGPIALIVAALATLAVGVYAYYKYTHQAREELEESKKTLNEVKSSYEEVNSAISEVMTTLNELNSKYDNLNDLKYGTNEWRDALREVNTELSDIIDKYNLEQNTDWYRDDLGVLHLTDSGQDKIDSANIKQKRDVQLAVNSAEVMVAQKEVAAEIEKIKYQSKYSGTVASKTNANISYQDNKQNKRKQIVNDKQSYNNTKNLSEEAVNSAISAIRRENITAEPGEDFIKLLDQYTNLSASDLELISSNEDLQQKLIDLGEAVDENTAAQNQQISNELAANEDFSDAVNDKIDKEYRSSVYELAGEDVAQQVNAALEKWSKNKSSNPITDDLRNEYYQTMGYGQDSNGDYYKKNSDGSLDTNQKMSEDMKSDESIKRWDLEREAIDKASDSIKDYQKIVAKSKSVWASIDSMKISWEEVYKIAEQGNQKLENEDGFKNWIKDNEASFQDFINNNKDKFAEILDVSKIKQQFEGFNFNKAFDATFIVENAQLIQSAMQGDADAVEELQTKLSDLAAQQWIDENGIAGKIEIETGFKEDDFENTVGQAEELWATLNNTLDDIEIGSSLDKKPVIDALNDLVSKTGISANKLQSYLSLKGFQGVTLEPQYEEVPLTMWDKFKNALGFTVEKKKVLVGYKLVGGGTKSGSDIATPLDNDNNNSGGGGGTTGSTGSDSKTHKDKKDYKLLSDIKERYHDITREIERQDKLTSRLSKETEKAYGLKKLQNYSKELKAINKTITLQNKKLKEAKTYSEKDLKQLNSKIKKNKEGTYIGLGLNVKTEKNTGEITNYDAVMKKIDNDMDKVTVKYNAYVSKYNKMSGKGQKANKSTMQKYEDEYNKAEKIYNARIKAMKQYEEDLDIVQEIQEAIKDAQDEALAKYYAQLTYKIEVKLDVNERDLNILETKLKLIQDNVYKRAEGMSILWNTKNQENKITKITQQLGIYQEKYDDLNEAYKKGKISQADFVEGLKDVSKGALTSAESLYELDQATIKYYSETLDMVQEQLDKYTNRINNISSSLEHYLKIMNLLDKNKEYEQINIINEALSKTAKNNYDIATKTYNMYKSQQTTAKKSLDDFVTSYKGKYADMVNDKTYEALLKNYDAITEKVQNSYEQQLSAAENYFETLNTLYENSIDQLTEKLENAFTNGLGFDTLNNSLQNLQTNWEEYLTPVNQAYELMKLQRKATQDLEKTNNMAAKQQYKEYQDYIKQLSEKNQLSNLELEIAQAKYKQLQAQIALEEAQNAKNVVRLSRDSEGNYGYVYTANKDAISDAQQQLDDANNNLYNIALKGRNDYGKKLIQAEQSLKEELNEIDKKYVNDEKKRLSERERATKEWGAIINTYSELVKIAGETDSRAVNDAWVHAYDDIINKGADWKKYTDEYIKDSNASWKDYHEKTSAIYKDLGLNAESYKNKVAELTSEQDKLSTEVTNQVIPTLDAMSKQVLTTTTSYAALRKEIYDTIAALVQLAETSGKDIQENVGDLSEYNNFVSGLASKKGYKTAADAQGVLHYSKDEKKLNQYVNAANKNPKAQDILDWNDKLGAKMQEKSKGYYVYDSTGKIHYSTASSKEKAEKFFNSLGIKFNKDKIKTFATGGYTGEWGNSGKLAMLHQKELVLNAEDTKNFLAGIEILRDVVQRIDLQAMYAGSTNISAASVGSSKSTLAQEVKIHAEFPNAVNHNEIEQAFDTLINRAAQYANRK